MVHSSIINALAVLVLAAAPINWVSVPSNRACVGFGAVWVCAGQGAADKVSVESKVQQECVCVFDGLQSNATCNASQSVVTVKPVPDRRWGFAESASLIVGIEISVFFGWSVWKFRSRLTSLRHGFDRVPESSF